MNRWLAFDIGTSAVKAALVNAAGQVLESASRPYETFSPQEGFMEQDARHWWSALVDAARELNAGAAEAVVVTGQMQDLILLDANGDPIRPVILYNDTRAKREIDEITQAITAAQLQSMTGNQQDASSLLAKLKWLLRHEPAHLERAATLLLGAADYAVFKLTGTAASDMTTASTTGLIDISARQMHPAAIWQALGLSAVMRILPALRDGGAFAGALLPEAAAALGINRAIPVYHAPGDAGAATLGVGSGESHRPYAYIGSSGWIGFSASSRANPQNGAFNLAHPSQGRFFCLAPLLTAGGNLDWFAALFDQSDHGTMIRAALQQPPTGLIYLPYLNGERSPFHDPFARGAFIGLNARHTRYHMARAALEGVVFAYRHALEALMPDPPERIMLTGGGTRTEAWCQLFADILERPVQVSEDGENVGVRGAVLSAQVASGLLSSYVPDGYFPIKESYQPNLIYQNQYAALYQQYLAAYIGLKEIFRGLADV